MSMEELYNLVGHFGDVVKMVYLKNKDSAIVEFSTHEEALKCMGALNKQIFYEQPLKICFSSYHKKIRKQKLINSLNALVYNQYFKVPKSIRSINRALSCKGQRITNELVIEIRSNSKIRLEMILDTVQKLVPLSNLFLLSNFSNELWHFCKLLDTFQI